MREGDSFAQTTGLRVTVCGVLERAVMRGRFFALLRMTKVPVILNEVKDLCAARGRPFGPKSGPQGDSILTLKTPRDEHALIRVIRGNPCVRAL